MKKAILTLMLFFAVVYTACAQQKSKTVHLIMTVVESPNTIIIGHSPNVFITRDDTAQVSQYVDFKLHVKARDAAAAHENQLMQLLQPYYNTGWRLVTATSEVVPVGFNDYAVTVKSRYFLIKDSVAL